MASGQDWRSTIVFNLRAYFAVKKPLVWRLFIGFESDTVAPRASSRRPHYRLAHRTHLFSGANPTHHSAMHN